MQDVLKLNSGTELLHAFQSARAELSSTGPAPFDQFVSLIPQDKRWDVVRGRWCNTRGKITTYDYVMQEIDHLIQMSSRMSPRMSSRMSAWLNPAKPEPIFSQTTAARASAGPAGVGHTMMRIKAKMRWRWPWT